MQMKVKVPVPDRVPGLGANSSGTNEVDEIPVPMSPSDFDEAEESLDDMIESASNVITDFDEV